MIIDPQNEDSHDWKGENVCVIRSKKVSGEIYYFLKPYHLRDKHTMMGGCFVYSCDSRFPLNRPLPLHDRVEG